MDPLGARVWCLGAVRTASQTGWLSRSRHMVEFHYPSGRFERLIINKIPHETSSSGLETCSNTLFLPLQAHVKRYVSPLHISEGFIVDQATCASQGSRYGYVQIVT